jgi:hypothetical protein
MGFFRWLRGEGDDAPGLVVLRENVEWMEAVMIRGLLDGAGIPVSVVTLDPGHPNHSMAPPRRVRLMVADDQLAEAEDLLAAPRRGAAAHRIASPP